MSTDITTRKRMSKYKESKTNTNVEIIRWESYMITYICVIEQLIKNRNYSAGWSIVFLRPPVIC